jgi:hypothetical protein
VKSQVEIQKAHDIFVQIVLGEVPHPFTRDDLAALKSALDALCWVLDHKHNVTFEQSLQAARDFLSKRGYELWEKRPH